MPRPILSVVAAAIAATAAAAGPPRAAGDAGFALAVASNFAAPAKALADGFAAAGGARPTLSFGATGKHVAQIVHGAPFAALLAADRERPEQLAARGLAIDGPPVVYAIGRLALWSPEPGRVGDGPAVLRAAQFAHLAIANPRLAPYGLAARQVLEGLDLWAALAPRLVRGENVAQAFQFVHSGNAELGFVALSQLRGPDAPTGGSAWVVPADRHAPIEQAAVLLRDDDNARAFLRYLHSDKARQLIRTYGYDLP